MISFRTKAALFAVVITAACAPAPTDAASDPAAARTTLVRVAPVEMRRVRRSVEASSYLESEHRVQILSKVAGRVGEVLVDEGSTVRKGDVIARLDPREAQTRTDQATVQLAGARVRLELAQLETDASKHRIVQARIERDRFKDVHERNTSMGEGLISFRELEASRYALDAAEEALLVAQFGERKALIEVQAARNNIAELDAKLAESKLLLDEHEVRAPLDGVVESRHVRGGETIGTATELFVVADPAALIAYLHRPQRELGLLRGARDVVFTTDAWPEREFTAAIDLLAPVVDQATGTFRVRIRVAAADAATLRPGMFVRAKILTEEERDALMVPRSAIVNDGAQSAVFVVSNGVARRIRLEPGLEDQEYVEARNVGDSGLAPGDKVVVSGHRDLRDQASVEIAE